MEERPRTNPNTNANPDSDSGTYVVQIPRDQIYRVPPPQNASIARRHKNKPSHKKSCRHSRLWRALFIFSGIIATFVLVLYVAFLVLNPRNATFTILRVVGSNSKPHSLDVSLKATNPNRRLGIYYMRGGRAQVLLHGNVIGGGNFPARYVKEKTSENVSLRIGVTAKRLEGGMMMGLKAEIPTRIKIWAVTSWRMKMRLACKFRVSSLGKGGRVTSQYCETKLGF